MPPLLYKLSRNGDGTWLAEFAVASRREGVARFQTKTKDRAEAEKRAKVRAHRLPIEDRAHERYRAKKSAARKAARQAARAAGRRGPGRPRKTPAPPYIDHEATAAKLRALPIEPTPDATPRESELEDAPPSSDDDGPTVPMESPPQLPPIDDTPTAPDAADPLQPEIVQTAGDAAADDLFADVIALAIVGGTVKLTKEWNARRDPPRRASEPHEKSLEWYMEGCKHNLSKLLGTATLSPTAKMVVGCAGVVISMTWGAELMRDAPYRPGSSSSSAAAPSSPPAPPQTNHDEQQADDDRSLGLVPVSSNGKPAAATGRFR